MWYRLIDWFSAERERDMLVSDFNKSAKNSYINKQVHTLLEARITIGSFKFRHASSKVTGGFRIKAILGQPLSKSELVEIGNVVIDNEELVRKLIVLGWDTLEVHDVNGYPSCKWPLKDNPEI